MVLSFINFFMNERTIGVRALISVRVLVQSFNSTIESKRSKIEEAFHKRFEFAGVRIPRVYR